MQRHSTKISSPSFNVDDVELFVQIYAQQNSWGCEKSWALDYFKIFQTWDYIEQLTEKANPKVPHLELHGLTNLAVCENSGEF